MKKISIIILIVSLLVLSILLTGCGNDPNEIKIGFIGAITGPVAKYGAIEAVQLAVEDINNNGGINGKLLKVIYEDGRCDSTEAVNAVNKLINIDQVDFILGGHCTPESAAIAPIVESNKVIMLASITSSPILTDMGDYVFRTTPISTQQSKMVADVAQKKGLKNIAIIYEQTNYAQPIAEKLSEEFKLNGGEVLVIEGFAPGTKDFKTVLTKAKGADSIFVSTQSPDAALLLMSQIEKAGLDMQIFGNDVAASQATIDKIPEIYEGFIAANPVFNEGHSKTAEFVKKYETKYNAEVPFGFWTADAYDGVYILAGCLEQAGEDVEAVKACLYNVENFEGASGTITIDENGDSTREYVVKMVENGVLKEHSF